MKQFKIVILKNILLWLEQTEKYRMVIIIDIDVFKLLRTWPVYNAGRPPNWIVDVYIYILLYLNYSSCIRCQ
jgi:hypothetical protein